MIHQQFEGVRSKYWVLTSLSRFILREGFILREIPNCLVEASGESFIETIVMNVGLRKKLIIQQYPNGMRLACQCFRQKGLGISNVSRSRSQ